MEYAEKFIQALYRGKLLALDGAIRMVGMKKKYENCLKWFRRWRCQKYHRRRWIYIPNKDFGKTGETKRICPKCKIEWYKKIMV